MARQNLAWAEEIPATDLPPDIQRIGLEALQAIWVAYARLKEEDDSRFKAACDRREQQVQEKYQEAQDALDRQIKEIAGLKASVDALEREKKALISNFDRKTGELQGSQAQLRASEERCAGQEHEIKRLSEELGRSREQGEYLQKRLDDMDRLSKQDQQTLRDTQDANTGHVRTMERLESHIKSLNDELEKARERLKAEHSKASVAEALAEEMKSQLNKNEMELKSAKGELQQRRESLESETKLRADAERKLAMFGTQLESQERVNRDTVSKLEQELSASKAELMALRNRVIKGEGALEREKKAVERLETRLAVLAGGKTGSPLG